MPMSKSPERGTFHANNYMKRKEELGEDPNPEYENLFKSFQERKEEIEADPEWQKDNLEYELRTTGWILEKVRNSEVYAQNLYAAMCNNEFQKLDVMPILKDQRCSYSWRYAGGIIADMRQEGDYIDWYCSGIRGDVDDTDLAEAAAKGYNLKNYVAESVVTEEIEADLLKLGWQVSEIDIDDI
jgi:hypothetical protein